MTYIFTFHHMLIFDSWYVSNGFFLLFVVNTYFIEGQHIVINYFILFIFSFSIYLYTFLLYFHKMKPRHIKLVPNFLVSCITHWICREA